MTTTTIGLAAARKNSRATTHMGWLAGGTLKLYTADRPADADTAITNQTLLATFTFANPMGTVSGAVITAAAIAAATIVASGTAAWARAADSGGVVVGDYDAGLSSAALILDNVQLIAGGLVSVISMTITEN